MTSIAERARGMILAAERAEELRGLPWKTVFSTWDAEFLQTETGRAARDEIVCARYNADLTFTVPWLARVLNLEDARVLEIGCGSGSSTAGLGPFCRSVRAYDIDEEAIVAARTRCDFLGVDNAVFESVSPDDLIGVVVSECHESDLVVFFAVIEHLLFEERIDYLRGIWDALPPGAMVAVVETPNRFSYFDEHTTNLPFFHLLPEPLAWRFLETSTRPAFKEAMRPLVADNPEAAAHARIRWGLGASYHEFQVGLERELGDLVCAGGFEREMLELFPSEVMDQLLLLFFLDRVPDVPLAFSRRVLNIILRKPRNDGDRAAAREFNERRRKELQGLNETPPEGLLSRLKAAEDMVEERWQAIQEMDQMIRQRDNTIAEQRREIEDLRRRVADRKRWWSPLRR